MRTAWLAIALWGCGQPASEPVPAPVPEVAALAETALAERRIEAGKHYRAQEYAEFVAIMTEVVAAAPDSTNDRYNLACGLALAGRGPEALAELRTLLAEGQDYGAGLDPDFASIRDTPEFQAYLADVAARFPPVSTSTEVLRVADWRLDPEGIAWDAAGGRYFLSSMTRGQVVAVAPDGTQSPFAQVTADVPLGTLGLAVDTARGRLWAVGTSFDRVNGFEAAHAGATGVFAFALADGAPVAAFMSPTRDPRGGFNDLAVAPDGAVYATGIPALTRIDPDAGTVTQVALDPPLDFANGITFTAEPGIVYLGARRGIARVDLTTGKHAMIGLPAGESVNSFDGLYYTDGRLVGIQLGGKWRAAEITLDATGTQAVAIRTLEQGNPTLTAATTGAVIGRELHYLARTRPSGVDLEAIPAGERGLAHVPVVMKAPIGIDAVAGE